MVQNVDAHNLPDFSEPLSDRAVCLALQQVAAGMVLHRDRRRRLPDNGLKHLTGWTKEEVNDPSETCTFLSLRFLALRSTTENISLREAAVVFPVVMKDLHPRAERRPPQSPFLGEPLRHLEGGEELSCLARNWCGRWTHSPDSGR